MTVITELPLYPEPYYQYVAELEDSNRVFQFRWVDRTSSWYMDILQDDKTPILLGIKLVAYFPIMADYQLQKHGITGFFVLLDKGATISDGLSDNDVTALSTHYRLFYINNEEV